MVNFGLNSASFLGIILAVAGAGLYFLRSIRPELSRDQDIAFTAIGIICGFILIFQGWRLDPILQFGQLLLSGSAIYFAYESIKLRGIANEQAKEKSQIVDERPVSRRYKAEIEDRELDERPRNSRRIKGDNANESRTENRRSNRRVEEDNEEIPRRRANTRQLTADSFAPETATRRRRTEPVRNVSSLARRDDNRWDDEDDWNETDDAPVPVRRALPDADLANDRSRRSTNPRRREEREEDPAPTRSMRERDNVAIADDDVATTPRRRRPRSVGEASRSENRPENPTTDRTSTGSGEGSTANYVDYEPIDPPSGLPPSGSEPIVFPDRY